mgnify:FL=1
MHKNITEMSKIEKTYIEVKGKKIYVRVYMKHNSSGTYTAINDDTKQKYRFPFEMLKYENESKRD